MTPEEGLRFLRLIRYAPRQPTISWLAQMSGYSKTALYDATRRDWMTQGMADRIGEAFQRVSVFDGHIVFFKNTRPGDFAELRGGARPGSGRKPGRERAPRTR